MTAPVFIRIDDVGRSGQRTAVVLEQLLARGRCVTCGVVPRWLTHGCARHLRVLASRHSEKLEIHQHGFAHLDHSAGSASPFKFEFSASRPLAAQQRELAAGRALLAAAFHDIFTPVLSPPFGHTDDVVRDLAGRGGFVAISGAPGEAGTSSVPGLSPQVDVMTWEPPGERSWEEVTAEWGRTGAEPVRGVALHAEAMTQTSAQALAGRLDALLRGSSTVRFADLLASVR